MNNFIESGKSVYVEGVDFALNHYLFPLFGYFGCSFVNTGNNANVQFLSGEEGTFAEGYQFEYQYGSDSDFEIDVISANGGTVFFTSQDGLGRGVNCNGDDQYHTIFTSTMFGAIIDNEFPNTKTELMNLYLTYLTQPLVSANEPIVSNIDLVGNYPNPFNPETTISFSTTEYSGNTEIVVYNLKGQKVKQLVSDQLSAGPHLVIWNGTDENNKPVPSGVYFYKMQTGKFTKTRKMILIK